jgi:hypothetical protein
VIVHPSIRSQDWPIVVSDNSGISDRFKKSH